MTQRVNHYRIPDNATRKSAVRASRSDGAEFVVIAWQSSPRRGRTVYWIQQSLYGATDTLDFRAVSQVSAPKFEAEWRAIRLEIIAAGLAIEEIAA